MVSHPVILTLERYEFKASLGNIRGPVPYPTSTGYPIPLF